MVGPTKRGGGLPPPEGTEPPKEPSKTKPVLDVLGIDVSKQPTAKVTRTKLSPTAAESFKGEARAYVDDLIKHANIPGENLESTKVKWKNEMAKAVSVKFKKEGAPSEEKFRPESVIEHVKDKSIKAALQQAQQSYKNSLLEQGAKELQASWKQAGETFVSLAEPIDSSLPTQAMKEAIQLFIDHSIKEYQEQEKTLYQTAELGNLMSNFRAFVIEAIIQKTEDTTIKKAFETVLKHRDEETKQVRSKWQNIGKDFVTQLLPRPGKSKKRQETVATLKEQWSTAIGEAVNSMIKRYNSTLTPFPTAIKPGAFLNYVSDENVKQLLLKAQKAKTQAK